MYLCSILLVYEKDHDDLINNDHGCSEGGLGRVNGVVSKRKW